MKQKNVSKQQGATMTHKSAICFSENKWTGCRRTHCDCKKKLALTIADCIKSSRSLILKDIWVLRKWTSQKEAYLDNLAKCFVGKSEINKLHRPCVKTCQFRVEKIVSL